MNHQPLPASEDSGLEPALSSPSPAASAGIEPNVVELLASGFAHHQAGRLAEAEANYRRILEIAPDHADVLHLLGGIAYQVGHYQVALDLISRAIRHNADDPSYYCSCGLALQGLDRLEEAIACYDRALAINPDFAPALINRGLALQTLERFTEALDSYDRALALTRDDPAALLNRGLALQALERFREALESYDRALAVRPDLAEAYYNRGHALQNLRRLHESVASYDRALALNPDFAEAWLSRGNVLQQLGRPVEALESYDRVLAISPDWADAHYRRGETLQGLERLEDAAASYTRALALKPDLVEAWLNRGNALRQRGGFAAALESYDRTLALRPDLAAAWVNRGNVLQELGRFGEALESYDRALAVRPDQAAALNNRGNVLQQLGRFDDALESYNRALAATPDYAAAHRNRSALLASRAKLSEGDVSADQITALERDYALAGWPKADWLFAKRNIWDWSSYREDEESARRAAETPISPLVVFALVTLSSTPAEQLACARKLAEEIAIRASSSPLSPRQRQPTEKIRLGYLSADFRDHPTAILVPGLIERHDRGRFEVVGYSYSPDDRSAVRYRLKGAFDRFVDICEMRQREAAELIQADAIDILIDLTGYASHTSRTEILAYRPAPIQVNYLGYPGTMGADFIDYVIADRFIAPADQQAFFSERLVHLPYCYQCNDDMREIAKLTPSREECGLPETGFVFCCFNNSYKINPTVFDVWMRLLAAVPGSVLWLVEPWATNDRAQAKINLAREAAARGVAPQRLVFAPRVPSPEHLARHRVADLFLDTLPYNAHTTASDALWAGLPLLTCAGNSFAGRVAGSLLRAVGLSELVTTSLEEYEALALRLVRDGQLLTRLRERLAQNRRSAPLFDTARFARDLEAAYLQMWERRNAGHPPVPISR